MEEVLLPLGTVVKTKLSELPLIIAGYYPAIPEKKRIATYVAVDCVLGFGNGENGVLLEQSDITSVVSKGFSNERGDEYRRNLYLMYEEAGIKEYIQQNLKDSGTSESPLSE